MADDFDRFLASVLAPAERAPDRQFVARTQARIALEECLAAQHRSLVAGLAKQLVALVAVAAAAWWIGQAAPIARWLTESPALAIAILLTGSAMFVGLISSRTGSDTNLRAAL